MLVYRKEIDGLRAVALLPVIFYHAGFTTLFPGGYVGVDVFFVISGYLITSLIDVELDAGTFSLINFYERRCRRILPALYVILLLTCYFVYDRMSPGQLEEFGYSLMSIVTFTSNIFFWWKDDNYFSRLSELNPVVHTWSLAVEEQFYLVFPLLCYLFVKKRHYLLILLGFLALLSLFLAQWGGNVQSKSKITFYMFLQHSWASFYMPLGRLWELLLGSFVVFYMKSGRSFTSITLTHLWTQVFALVGLSLIIGSVLLFDTHRIPPFPNGYTLAPTFGTALIIIFGKHDTLVGRLLSTQPLRWIGLISYSAYLWHQPLLVYLRLRSITMPTASYISFITVAVLLLASICYFFVEQPFRNRTLFSRRHIFCISTLGALLVFLVALFLLRASNYRSLVPITAVHNKSVTITAVHNKSVTINRMVNRSLGIRDEEDTYLFDIEPIELSNYVTRRFNAHMNAYPTFSNSSAATNRRIILIGDSFAQDFMNMIAETHSLLEYEIRCHYVQVYCQIYMGAEDRLQWIASWHRSLCINRSDIKFALPMIRLANIIIFASNWREWSARRLPKTIEILNLTSSQKLLVLGVKNFGLVNLTLYVNKSYEFRVQQYQTPETEAITVNTIMKQTLNPSIFVDVMSMTCVFDNGTCPVFTPEGKIISYDGGHTTKHGARYVGDIIFKQFPLNQL